MYVTQTRHSNIAGIVPWIISEAKKGTNQIGFIPQSRYEQYHQAGSLFVCVDQNELLAFIAVGRRHPTAKIHQLWTRNDVRRHLAASLLVATFTEQACKAGCRQIEARVASDLEANHFWKSAGFIKVGTHHPANARKREINVYRYYDERVEFLPGCEPAEELELVTATNMKRRLQEVLSQASRRAEQPLEESSIHQPYFEA